MAWAESISPDRRAAPPRAHNRRNGASVTPTIGDKITLCSRVSEPSWIECDKTEGLATDSVKSSSNSQWGDWRRRLKNVSRGHDGFCNTQRRRSSRHYPCKRKDSADRH